MPIRRAWFCPFASRSQAYLKANSNEVLNSNRIRYAHIPVASACLLEAPNGDGLIVTRRPWHMRSYPGQWVPPGGHCDSGEPVEITAVRELCEELGLECKSRWTESLSTLLHPLCAWEAAYPSVSPPKSHHLVLYYAASWPNWAQPQGDFTALTLPHLNLQQDEVDSAVWLPTFVLRTLVNDWMEFEHHCQQSCTTLADLLSLNAPLSGSMAVNNLDERVWLWTAGAKCWRLENLNRLVCGLTTNPHVMRTRSFGTDEHHGPSCLSTGTLYAISRWLSWHDSVASR